MSPRTLAAYVLRALANAQLRGRTITLDGLVERLQVRRGDVRSVVTALHRKGLVDATTMRLTLQGFAIGTALKGVRLPSLRTAEQVEVRAALCREFDWGGGRTVSSGRAPRANRHAARPRGGRPRVSRRCASG